MNDKLPLLHLFAVYACRGAQDERCKLGPIAVRHAEIEQSLSRRYRTQWHSIDSPRNQNDASSFVHEICELLASSVKEACQQGQRFVVLGGDHSCAIGTWSGARRHYQQERLGLIWIDAHMDSHLPETSPSKAIHGMPLACLLGHGEKIFRTLSGSSPAILPQNICLIGVRSYEPEEEALLNILGVKIFYMRDVEQLGFEAVLQQSVNYLKQRTDVYGISIDLDAFDPDDAPGVGSPEQNGLKPGPVIASLSKLRNDPTLLGLEIVELNPAKDDKLKTAKLCVDLANAIF